MWLHTRTTIASFQKKKFFLQFSQYSYHMKLQRKHCLYFIVKIYTGNLYVSSTICSNRKKAIEESKELPLPFICVNFFLIRVMKIDLIFVSELRMKIMRSHYSTTKTCSTYISLLIWSKNTFWKNIRMKNSWWWINMYIHAFYM